MTNAEKVAEAQGAKAQQGSTEAAREIRMATELDNKVQPEEPTLDPDLIQALREAASKPTVEEPQ